MKSKSNPFLRQSLALAALITLIAPAANADNSGNYDWTGASLTNDNFTDAANWGGTWDQWSDYRFGGAPARTSATINDFFGIGSITLQSGLTTDIVINTSFTTQDNPVIMSTGQAGGTSASITIAADSKDLTINGRYIVGGSPVTWNVGAGRALTLNGALENWYGTASLVKNGDGTAVLNGASSYTGGTTINGGTLKVQGGGPARSFSIASGAVLNLDGNTGVANGTWSISGGGTLLISGGGFSNGSGPGHNINMELSSGALIEIQSGASMTNGGWQSMTWTNNLAGMKVDGSFDINDGNAVLIGALTGSGTITTDNYTDDFVNSKTLTVGKNNGSGTFSGVITQQRIHVTGLTKDGGGTQTLTGANDYKGATTITGGTLQIGDGGTIGTLGSGAVTIESGAFLTINRSDNYGTVSDQSFSGAGTLVKEGTGELVINGTFNANNSVANLQNLTINNGLVRTDNFGLWKSDLNLTATGSGILELWNTSASLGTLNGNGTVRNTVNFGNPVTTLTVAAGSFSGTITDNGGGTTIALLKSGAGTLTLSGANSYGGSTSVEGGTLAVVGSLPAASTVTVGSGGTLNPGTVGATGILNAGTTNIAGTLAIDLDATSSDRLVVTGDLDISGSTLAINPLALPAATPYTVATYSGTLTGSFVSPPSGYTINYGTGTNSAITLTKSDSDYDTWAGPSGYNLSQGSSGDDDSDGQTNFEEYAFGLIPNSGSSVNPITSQLSQLTKKFSYTRRKPSLGTNLTYSVWFSENLVGWTKDTSATEGTPVPSGDNETVEVTLSALPGNPLPAKLFIQVRAN